MKNKLLLIVAIVISSLVIQAQTTTAFRKNYNQALFDLPGNIVEGLTPNTYVMAGTNMTFLPIYGTVTQLNDTGGVTWSYRYSDASLGFQLNDIKKDAANSQYYACGGSESNAAVFMVLDATGNIVIQKKFKINEADGAWFNRVIKASDGGYVAVGYVTGHDPDGAGPEIKFNPITWTSSTNGNTKTEAIGSPIIVKLDASGNHVWHRVFRYYIGSVAPANRIYNDASFTDVVEVSDGYVAVGSYDVNQFRSVTSGNDEDDATPTDAMMVKTTTAGAITYHKQIDAPSSSTSQSSKYYGAVNKTSVGDIITGGSDNSKEMIQKFTGAGGFANVFSRDFTYSTTFLITDPSDISQIYEVPGGTDLVTMAMYIKPLSFFANSIHRVNPGATANVWAKRYNFNLISILPRGSITADGGYAVMAMTAGGTDYDYHVIRTDPSGDTPLTGCPATSFSPTASAGPGTFADPLYNSWNTGTVASQTITISRISIAPTPSYVCTKIMCTPPAAATTTTATPATICAGQSTTITASGPATGVSYQVWTAATGGTNLGNTPLVVSPSGTTTYYIQTVNNSDGTCVSLTRVPVTVTVNPAPSATIAYSGAAYCQTAGVQSVTQTGTSGGTYSATPAGLTINASTGAITPSSSSVGTYTVTYSIAAAPPCSAYSTTTTVQIISAPSATVAYTGSPYCTSAGVQSVTFSGTSGGTYSATPAGLTINASTGAITPSTSTPGTYTVTYSIAASGGCSAYSTTASVTITAAPSATIAYTGGSGICSSASPLNVTQTGTTGGTYSASPSGLSINASTGQITPGSSTAGTYTVTYTIPASGGCSTFTTTANVTITAQPTGSIAYSGTVFCASSTSETVTLTAPAGGTYSATPAGLTINASTGTITPNTSSIGAYTVTYTLPASGGCPAYSTTANITISAAPTATISYAPASLCVSSTSSVVALSGSGGGTYSATPAGLSINSSTGTINPSTSTPGTYTVTYTVPASGGCPTFSTTTNVTINTLPTATAGAAGGVTTLCVGNTINLTSSGGTSYSWTGPNSYSSSTQNPSIPGATTAESGVYTVTVTDANSCSASATVNINVLAPPTAGISTSSVTNSVCTGSSITITATGGGTYSWNTGSTASSITVSPTTNTTYWVIVSIGTCTDSAGVNVTVNPLPTVTASGNATPICAGGNISLTSSGGVTYSWTGPNSFTSTAQNPSITGASAAASGTYIVTVTDANGCVNTANATVTVNTLPTITILGGSTVCAGQSITLTATGATSYVWNTGATTSSITVSPTGATTYTVTATDANGCVNTQTQTVTVNPIPTANAGADATICSGTGAMLSASGGTTYLWNNGATTSSIIVNPTSTTTYFVTVSNGTCSDNDTVVVNVNPSPTAGVSSNVTITQGTSTNLLAAGGGTYSWSPTAGLSCTTCANPTATPNQTTDYCVTVSNGSCADTACVRITVDIVCGELFIPNAFSPNNDGVNDVFRVKVNPDCVLEVQLYVYDRWGEKVFEATSPDAACVKGWDGTYNGKALDNAVFVYYLNILLTNGTETQKLKGNVSLIR